MKKAIKITLITIAIVIAVMILAIVILFMVASKQPMVKNGYYNDVQTNAPLEQKYTKKGDYEVSYYEQNANNKQWKTLYYCLLPIKKDKEGQKWRFSYRCLDSSKW